ncbi:MAG: 30S ribosomal protein S16 [Chitinophagales bacterium]|nr:30S ribosomal protein S16 [Chitinophagales bacterium]
MPVKIRLQRHGRGKRPFYHIVIADSRSKRDGRFIERIGDYNPLSVPATINVDVDKAVNWMEKGAQPTNTVRAILSYKGALYLKHLRRGLRKGALTEQEVESKYQTWVSDHENAVLDKVREISKTKASEKQKVIDAEAKKREEKDEAKRAALQKEEAAANAEAQAAEGATEVAEAAPADENASAAEETTAAPAEEAAVPAEEKKTEEAPKEEAKAEETPAEAKAEETPAEEPKAEEGDDAAKEEGKA